MIVYCTSRNTLDRRFSPPHLVYLGTSIERAELAVGAFSIHQRPEDRFPSGSNMRNYSIIPMVLNWEMIQFFMSAGQWYSIVKFELKEE